MIYIYTCVCRLLYVATELVSQHTVLSKFLYNLKTLLFQTEPADRSDGPSSTGRKIASVQPWVRSCLEATKTKGRPGEVKHERFRKYISFPIPLSLVSMD